MCCAFLEPHYDKLKQQKNKPGLYLVATPIGNIFDISLRALHILSSADVIFAEDTRNSKKLLSAYDIHKPLIACHEFNEVDEAVTSVIVPGRMCALISDAGTPGISDPGYRIVNWCIDHDIDVVPIPGPCAFITGLCASGMPTDSFTFYGFLSAKSNSRKEFFKKIRDKRTAIFLESPKRVLGFLRDAIEVFDDVNCCICRELTKLHETFHRGTVSQMIEYFSQNEPLGEFVIILQLTEHEIAEKEIDQELAEILKTHSIKDAVQIVSSMYNVSKKLVYKKALEMK